MHFTHAIVRPPAANFADGLTMADLGAPDVPRALAQHAAYCRALEACGLALTWLPEDARYPDSTFVEDTAVITPHVAVLTRPGHPAREGEAAAIEPALAARYDLRRIVAPGTVDGGDICEAGTHVFIGLSERTNPAGGEQLARHLEAAGHTTTLVRFTAGPGLLHLKSGVSHVGGRDLVIVPALAGHPAFQGWNLLVVDEAEAYAANCVRVNDRVLVPEGYPRTAALLERHGYRPLALDMSEFMKMDGGLSCLSLRLP
jgi:dimethylargininase